MSVRRPSLSMTPEARRAAKRAQPAPRTAFVARLWTLLRIKTVLDAETAASTLTDADSDVIKAQRTAMAYLNAWARQGVVAVSSYEFHGQERKRFVLVNDGGPVPPKIRRPGPHAGDRT